MSLTTNEKFDLLPTRLITYVASMYADPKVAVSISAVNQDLRNFPPVLVEVGDAEILLDQILLFVERLKEAGKETNQYVECQVRQDMTHSFQMLHFSNMKQILESFQTMKVFIEKLDELNSSSVAVTTAQVMERGESSTVDVEGIDLEVLQGKPSSG